VRAIPRSRHRRLDHRASRCPVWRLDARQRQPGTADRNTSARPRRPPDDSTPILIRRVRRRRHRLRSNGSIGSDSAIEPQRSTRAHMRRVTPDRVLLTFIARFNARRLAAVISFHYSTAIAPQRRQRRQLRLPRSGGRRPIGTSRPCGNYQGNACRQEETADRHGAEESE
jgi:hypothetical protein